jgi:hypothetical protein
MEKINKETVVINVVIQAFEKRLCDNIDDNTTSRHENRHEMTPEKRVIFGVFLGGLKRDQKMAFFEV